jgi:hypothetical protein
MTSAAKIFRRAAGAALALGGILTLVVAGRNAVEMISVLRPALSTGQFGVAVANLAFAMIFASISVACIISGVQLTREKPAKPLLLLGSLVPQLFSIVVSGFQYRFSPAGFLGAAAYSVGPIVRVGILVQNGTQVILGFDPMDEWVVQLNLAAVVIGALLLIRPRSKAGSAIGDHGRGVTAEPADETVDPSAGTLE